MRRRSLSRDPATRARVVWKTLRALCVVGSALSTSTTVAAAPGCSAGPPDPARPLLEGTPSATEATPVQAGKLIVRFTISDRTDPDECTKGDVKDFELTLASGDRLSPKGTWRHQCEAFALSVTLPPGTYTGSAVLLDDLHAPRTTHVDLDAFTVHPNETVEATVGFPSSSFLE